MFWTGTPLQSSIDRSGRFSSFKLSSTRPCHACDCEGMQRSAGVCSTQPLLFNLSLAADGIINLSQFYGPRPDDLLLMRYGVFSLPRATSRLINVRHPRPNLDCASGCDTLCTHAAAIWIWRGVIDPTPRTSGSGTHLRND